MSLLGILSLLVLTIVLALWGMGTLQRGRAERDALTHRAELGFTEPPRSRLHAQIDQALRRTGAGRALARRLAFAGLQLTVLDAVLITAGAVVAATLAIGAVFGRVTGLAAGVLAIAFGNVWLSHRQEQRQERFIAQLPEAARVMSNALSAGLAMPAAMAMVANEVPDPAGAEFRQTVHGMRMGLSADAALEGMADRLPSRELGVLVSTLAVQQRAGGDLVGALRDISETLEARKGLREELKTETSGSVATSFAVLGLVGATTVIINVISPGIIDQLTTTLVGRAVVLVVLLMYIAGFMIIRRITKIEV